MAKIFGRSQFHYMKDGTEKTIVAGESYSIPSGHDAWVEGNQPFVGIEAMSADVYAKP
jgi:hypothetical protein